ncbi:MAG: hypothetical protein ACI8Z9_001480 [Paraglaciecola sp.]|jgi:hypothetical protein
MKNVNFDRDRRKNHSNFFPVMMERRRSFYRGKYNGEVFTVIILFACVALFILR